MPRAQDATTWTPQLKRKAPTSEGPVIWTKADRRDGSRPVEVVPGTGDPWTISESFDGLRIWSGNELSGTSGHIDDGAPLPGFFEAARSAPPAWAPETAPIEITDDPQYTRGGTGKAILCRRFANDGDTWWHGDGILAKHIPATKQMYFSYWIKFQPGWTPAGSCKAIRVGYKANLSSNPDYFNTSISGEEAGNKSPILLWNWNTSQTFGIRNRVSIRNNKSGTNWSNPATQGLPVSGPDLSQNFGSHIYSLDGGPANNNPQIPDLVNGGVLDGSDDTKNHDQVFGDQWAQIEFYVQMNSAPGASDGVMAQWFKGQLILLNTQMPWIQADGNPDAVWNYIALGGNDYWPYDEFLNPMPKDPVTGIQTYSLDDLEIKNHLPSHLALEPMQ